MVSRLLISFFLLFIGAVSDVDALEKPGEELNEAGIKTVLGTKVDLSLEFTDSSGEKKPLSGFLIPSKPAIIVPGYYDCPRLCGLVFRGVQKLLQELTLKSGKDFQVLTVSIDSKETPKQAGKFSKQYYEGFPEGSEIEKGWRFLVGDDASVKALMKQIGFGFVPDAEEFAHSSLIVILTPTGEISQYFTGIEFPSFDARLALVEASKGEVGTPLDHVFLFCFRFDETQGKYTWAAFNLMRAGAGLFLVCLVGLLVTLWRRELRLKREGVGISR